jgi:hypothetical protein
MTRLLRVAEWCCGPSQRASVFEPLLADWERERHVAATRSAHARAWVAACWWLGFLAALIGCAARHALSADGPLWRYGIIVFLAFIAVSLAAETAVMEATRPPIYSVDLHLIAVLGWTNLATFAAAMLPAMFLLRRNPRATARTAARSVILGSLLTAAAVVAQPSLKTYRPTFDQLERSRERALANYFSGRIQYANTVRAELDSRGTTLEQRRARYDEWRTQTATGPTPTPWEHLRRSTAPVMAAVFGLIGWMLGGVIRPTFTRAATWWLAAWLSSQIAGGHIVDMLDLPPPQPAWWVMPAIAGTLALALHATSHRRRA